MYILKKILNSSTTTPEFVRCKTDPGIKYKKGMPLKVNSFGVAINCSGADLPTHITCENLNEGEADSVLTFIVTHDMIFSATAGTNVSTLGAGTKVVAGCDNEDFYCLITNDTQNGIITIVDNCNANSAGKRLLVSF